MFSMKKRYAFLLFFIVSISGCATHNYDELNSTLIGSWKSDSTTKHDIRILMHVEYFQNKTCKTDIKYINNNGESISHQLLESWKVIGDEIHFKVLDSSKPDTIGGESHVKVISLERNEITIQSPNFGHISKLIRVNKHNKSSKSTPKVGAI